MNVNQDEVVHSKIRIFIYSISSFVTCDRRHLMVCEQHHSREDCCHAAIPLVQLSALQRGCLDQRFYFESNQKYPNIKHQHSSHSTCA